MTDAHETPALSVAEHNVVTAAVTAAERASDGEIVTIIADRSDGYTDVALAWAAAIAFLALATLAIWPDDMLSLYDRLTNSWTQDWTPRGIFALATTAAAMKFGFMLLIQLWPPLKYLLVPAPIKSRRVRGRAIDLFRVGAEKRTVGLTGVLIYLSMREHRAEIVADEAIVAKVAPEVWGEAMAAMLAEVKTGQVAAGMAEAVRQIGIILAENFPKSDTNPNELPDRLIEL
ncbi:hypothetical protein FSZ31_05675 [Sphingorhabdus soli]|uniref:TPM domain-containing protein n=1 Tax=Flavisphingopyxis soli TaxID=2601267 RepID=A0A5C6UME0_9SPHN|nr:hypothetical protein [Sphingorhabdus soli]TXC74197.1 hypothetical protein FSZ31_05675 [Sphingorhabdus soli]